MRGSWALNPEFIVCDEPVSALDVSIQAQVLNLMQDLQEQLNLTYLFITHDLSVVKHLSNTIIVMYLGQIVETAPPDEIFAHPMHPYTQALLSAIPIPDPDIQMKRVVRVLEDDLHTGTQLFHLFFGVGEDILPVEEYLPLCGLVQAEDGAPQGGLPASGLSDYTGGLPLFDGEGYVVNRVGGANMRWSAVKGSAPRRRRWRGNTPSAASWPGAASRRLLRLDGHIQGGGGLVRNQDAGTARKSNCDDNALFHTAGELVRVVVQPLCRQAHQLHHLAGPAHGVCPGETLMHTDSLGNLFADGHHRIERGHGMLSRGSSS